MTSPVNFREAGKRLSNWGKWGVDDRLGTLNYTMPSDLVAAGALIRTGKLFDLGLPVSAQGIQTGNIGRNNPVHLMSMTPCDMHGASDGIIAADDQIFMPLQSVTQWDGLAHVGYDDRFYNDVPATSVTSLGGSAILSIDQIAARGVAGRGVLLDIARLKNLKRLEAGAPISGGDLADAAKAQGVEVRRGDILLIRTGWLNRFVIDNDLTGFWNGEPGIDLSAVEWLHGKGIAAVASDNWAVEVIAPDCPPSAPLHCVLIRDMGMTLGELFVLDALADDCDGDGVWEFFFSAPPLKVVGGVGSPITPLAIK